MDGHSEVILVIRE